MDRADGRLEGLLQMMRERPGQDRSELERLLAGAIPEKRQDS